MFCKGSSNKGLAVIAGLSEDASRATIVISNLDGEFNSYDIRVTSIPWDGKTKCEVYILDIDHNLDLTRTEEFDSSSFSIVEDVKTPVDLPDKAQ